MSKKCSFLPILMTSIAMLGFLSHLLSLLSIPSCDLNLILFLFVKLLVKFSSKLIANILQTPKTSNLDVIKTWPLASSESLF